MSVSVNVSDVSKARDLLVLYGKKGAFELSEYVDVGKVYKTIIETLDSSVDKKRVEMKTSDVNYIINAINVCSQRVPVEVQNYKTIGNLFESFATDLKKALVDDEEKKSSD